MEFEEKWKSIRLDTGVTVYDHMMNIIGKAMIDKHENPYEDFELISNEMKLKGNLLNVVSDLNSLIREEGSNLTEHSDLLRNFFRLSKKVELVKTDEEETPEPVTEEILAPMPLTDFQTQEELSSRAGIGFGRQNVRLLQNAINIFSSKYNSNKCRFWGRISGLNADYYVIESSVSIRTEGEGEKEGEAIVDEVSGTGINQTYYCVSTDILKNNWVELPAISAKQLRQARGIKRAFTGDLNQRIISDPMFEGEERHLVG